MRRNGLGDDPEDISGGLRGGKIQFDLEGKLEAGPAAPKHDGVAINWGLWKERATCYSEKGVSSRLWKRERCARRLGGTESSVTFRRGGRLEGSGNVGSTPVGGERERKLLVARRPSERRDIGEARSGSHNWK